MNEGWLSVQEIAAHLGVNRNTIHKSIERGTPAQKGGELWKFLVSKLDFWVKRVRRLIKAQRVAAPKKQSNSHLGSPLNR